VSRPDENRRSGEQREPRRRRLEPSGPFEWVFPDWFSARRARTGASAPTAAPSGRPDRKARSDIRCCGSFSCVSAG